MEVKVFVYHNMEELKEVINTIKSGEFKEFKIYDYRNRRVVYDFDRNTARIMLNDDGRSQENIYYVEPEVEEPTEEITEEVIDNESEELVDQSDECTDTESDEVPEEVQESSEEVENIIDSECNEEVTENEEQSEADEVVNEDITTEDNSEVEELKDEELPAESIVGSELVPEKVEEVQEITDTKEVVEPLDYKCREFTEEHTELTTDDLIRMLAAKGYEVTIKFVKE